MSWQTEDGKHEGWATAWFPDDMLGIASQGGLIQVAMPQAEGRLFDYSAIDAEMWRSRDEVAGFQIVCDCGWRGTLWTRVRAPAEQDIEKRLLFSEDGYADDFDELLRPEWAAHIAPDEALRAVAEAAEELNAVTAPLAEQLEVRVLAARALGASWTDVGRAVGISRQSAHERWAKREGARAHGASASMGSGGPGSERWSM